jgi:hypothetical protein
VAQEFTQKFGVDYNRYSPQLYIWVCYSLYAPLQLAMIGWSTK